MKEKKKIIKPILCTVAAAIGFACFFSARWYISVCGDLGFDSIIYTLMAGLGGVASNLINDYLLKALVPIVICTALVALLLFVKLPKKLKLPSWILRAAVLVLTVVLIVNAAVTVDLIGYVSQAVQKTDIYETEYIDPKTAAIEFPDQKRNLIIIYLESMETTYLSREQGGGNDFNAIPELFRMANENINFSHNDTVGGFSAITGGTWTTGALVSITAGIPMRVPIALNSNGYSTDETFLPGVTNLSDILKAEGYYQTLMVGSDAEFGGRKPYFEQHGTDKIYDLFTARQDGIIPEDYHVWWGMEDYYLFEYAKQELVKISQSEQPFAFSMLTVDTHHIGGYMCESCEQTYSEHYENVLACSSKQVTAFVEWIKQQDFYQNTTVVVTGDHPTMDGAYVARNAPKGYERHVYNCFINAAATPKSTKNRKFTTTDMLPTILASMGCKIEGERLGLGTNLFSETPTLCEKLGTENLKRELQKTSDYYSEKFY